MVFQIRPVAEDQWYFEVYADSGERLASSVFFDHRQYARRAADTIIAGCTDPPTEVLAFEIKHDLIPGRGGQWYFDLYADQAQLIATSARFATQGQMHAAMTTFTTEASWTGPDTPVINS